MLGGLHLKNVQLISVNDHTISFVSTEDYSQYEDIVTTTSSKRLTPGGGTLQQCDYDPCLEGQTSCFQLAISTHCLCRGLPLNEVPKAPSLSSVSWNGSKVVLKWCAPYSHVTAYIVTVGGEERMTFGEGERSGAVGDIDDIAEVCVKAGCLIPAETSCHAASG
uniref:Fibronectin type-III domain-containing protein n=1 Tax=Amphilophus citrinellus TaxID=61819 RepID=A0A3Q0RY08_AMPCI